MSYFGIRIFTKLSRFVAMPASERATTVAIVVLIPIVSGSLALFGLARTLKWIRRTSRRQPGVAPGVTVVSEGVAALQRARYYTPWSGRCLARSLALWWVLRRRGVDAALHIGARLKDGALDAHAWVTHGARVLADSQSVWTDFPALFPAGADLEFRQDR